MSLRIFDLSSGLNDKLTMKVEVYNLAKPKTNPYEQVEKWLGYFNKLIDSKTTGDAVLTVAKDAGELALEGLKNVATGQAGEKIKDITTALLSDMVYSGEMADDGAFVDGEAIAAFQLDLPQSLTNRLSHQYDIDELSVEEQILRKFPAYMVAKAVSTTAYEKIGRMAGLAFELAKRQGRTVDPNIITTYKSTDMRDFTFVINIIPKSKVHSKEVLDAILALKTYMTGVRETLDVYQDKCFKIVIENNYIKTYMMLTDAELNLVKLDVDMGVDGGMQLYDDGTPKHLQVTFMFQERRPLRRESDAKVTSKAPPPKPVDVAAKATIDKAVKIDKGTNDNTGRTKAKYQIKLSAEQSTKLRSGRKLTNEPLIINLKNN